MALVTFILPACSTAEMIDSGKDTTSIAPSASITESPLTTPNYYNPIAGTPNSAYTPENQLKLLADRDFGGSYFLIVQEEGLENAIFPTSDELVSVYADRRNRLVQEKYNVQLSSRTMSADEIIEELTENAKTGIYFCDLLIISPSLLQKLQEKDLLVALDTLPFFETDSICISAEATAELNSGWNGIYGIWGDVLRQPTRQLTLYFNEAMAESLGISNPYAAVQSGAWDFGKLIEAASLAVKTGKQGIIYDGSAADLLLGASGISSASDEGQALLADPAFLAAVESLEKLFLPATVEEGEDDTANEGDNAATPEGSPEATPEGSPEDEPSAASADATDTPVDSEADEPITPPSEAYTRFISGESLFYIGRLGELDSFAQTEEVFGILPIPKYNASAESYPILTDQSVLPVLACPVNVASAAGTGIMLSALNAASCDEINSIFLQSAEEYVRTNGSFVMLPYLVGNPSFDRKLIFGL